MSRVGLVAFTLFASSCSLVQELPPLDENVSDHRELIQIGQPMQYVRMMLGEPDERLENSRGYNWRYYDSKHGLSISFGHDRRVWGFGGLSGKVREMHRKSLQRTQ